MTNASRLYVGVPRATARGLTYRVTMGSPSGPVIVEASTEPLLAGCRALLAMGITGQAELWDYWRPFPRLAGDISKLATLTADETASPTFRRWRAFPAVTGAPKTAKRDSGLPDYPEIETAVFARYRTAGKGM